MVAALAALLVLASAAPAHAAKPYNGRIAVTVVRGSGTFEAWATRIVTMRPDGAGHRVLPCAARFKGDCFDSQPDYSNDGRRLVSITEAPELAHAVVRTGEGRVLSQYSCDCFNAAWAPGRRYLAFARYHVALLNLRAGRERGRLRMGTPEHVDWSRQGSLVADSSGISGPFIVREPNGRRRRIRARGSLPEWAPDGKRFAYVCPAGACVVGKNGRGRRVLPRGRACVSGSFDGVGTLAWSPDGRKLACFASGNRYSGVIVINLRTRRIRSIAPNVFLPGSIDWQPSPGR